MTLRARLLLGYGYLVALLLLAAGSALLGFLHLSDGIDTILEENFRSIRASTQMLDALERQDSATLAALFDGQAGPTQMREYEASFEEALVAAENNVTEPEESGILERLRARYEEYRKRRESLVAARPDRPLAEYNREVLPAFSRTKDEVLRLLDVNHQAMIRADQQAKEAAIRNGAWLGLLVAVTLISFVLLTRALQRLLLNRLARLNREMAAITQGEWQRRLDEEGDDELTAIARHFDEVVERRVEIEARSQGRLSAERRLTLALARHCSGRASVFDLSGRLMVGEVGPERRREQEALGEWIRTTGRELAERGGNGDRVVSTVQTENGRGYRVALLTTPDHRTVGWLAAPEEG